MYSDCFQTEMQNKWKTKNQKQLCPLPRHPPPKKTRLYDWPKRKWDKYTLNSSYLLFKGGVRRLFTFTHLFICYIIKGKPKKWRLGERRAEHQYGSQPHCLPLKWEQGAASDLSSIEIWRSLLIDEEENGWATQVSCSYWQPPSPVQWSLGCLGAALFS